MLTINLLNLSLSMIRVYSSQNIPNKDLSSGPKSRWANAKCEEKIKGFGDRFYTEVIKQWNKDWNCDLKTGVNCGLPDDKFEEISCCMSFDAFDRMSEELKKVKECNASDIESELNVTKDDCHLYVYHSDECTDLRLGHKSSGCDRRIKEIQLKIKSEVRENCIKDLNCYPNESLEKCGISAEKAKGIECCVKFESIDRMNEELKNGYECDHNYIDRRFCENTERTTKECPHYGYQSNKTSIDCAKLQSIGFPLKPIPCVLYLMASLFIVLFMFKAMI